MADEEQMADEGNDMPDRDSGPGSKQPEQSERSGNGDTQKADLCESQLARNEKASALHGRYLFFAILYALVLVACGATVNHESIMPHIVYAVIVATLSSAVAAITFLVGCWSVLGPGSYWKRVLVTHLVGAIPIAGFCIGLFVSGGNEVFLSSTTNLLLVVPISLGVQLPFWFLRAALGWQLVPKRESPQVPYSLADIFIVTFAFAAFLALAQWSANFAAQNVPDGIGSILAHNFDANGQPIDDDYEIVGKAKNHEQIRARYSSDAKEQVVAANAFAFFGSAFLAASIIPILPRMFHSKNVRSGCRGLCIYLLVLILLPFGVMITVGYIFQASPPPLDAEILTTLVSSGATMFGFAFAVWIPLLTSRYQGVQLFTNRRRKVTLNM